MTMYVVFLIVSTILFAVIVGYSWYQKNQSNNKSEQQDYVAPLFEELEEQKRQEKKQLDPVLDEAVSSVQDTVSEQVKLTGEPVLETPNEKIVQEVNAVVDQVGTSNEHPQTDVITDLVARIKNEQAIEQQDLLVLFRKYDYKFNRKVNLYGLNELTDLWRDVEHELPSARFLELGLSIQLADRDGCMSKKELHDFQQMVLEFSNGYDAPFEFSMDLDVAQQQAVKLDELGRRYDSMAVLNVVPKSKAGFRLADIESCARDLRMSTDSHGIFIKTQGQKQALSVLYRLACTDGSGHFGVKTGSMTSVHDLVIYMNVPATAHPDGVFQEMIKDANSLATWLDGKVVDRYGKTMTQRSYSLLTSQINDIVLSMQGDNLSPGDAVSKKIF